MRKKIFGKGEGRMRDMNITNKKRNQKKSILCMGMRGREKKLHEQKIEDILKFEDKTRRENGEGK